MTTILTVITAVTFLFSQNVTEAPTRLESLQECQAYLSHIKVNAEKQKNDKDKDVVIESSENFLAITRIDNLFSKWVTIYICTEIKT